MLRGYITNLGAYNHGQLKGEWINFPITDEELKTVMERIGNPEEYFFTDWDNDICEPLGEFESIDHINELAEELDCYEADLISALMEVHNTLDEALDHADNAVFYAGMTLEDVAYELVEAMELPEIAKTYFDYESFARDLGFDGYTETKYGVIC